MDINPENNKDTFQARGAKIEELQKEIKRLRSLCLRAADEIEMLDDIIVRNNLEEQMNEEYPGMASVNLLSRLRGRLKGGYVENYPELTEKE
jgi:archaellum component FlaC